MSRSRSVLACTARKLSFPNATILLYAFPLNFKWLKTRAMYSINKPRNINNYYHSNVWYFVYFVAWNKLIPISRVTKVEREREFKLSTVRCILYYRSFSWELTLAVIYDSVSITKSFITLISFKLKSFVEINFLLLYFSLFFCVMYQQHFYHFYDKGREIFWKLTSASRSIILRNSIHKINKTAIYEIASKIISSSYI